VRGGGGCHALGKGQQMRFQSPGGLCVSVFVAVSAPAPVSVCALWVFRLERIETCGLVKRGFSKLC
jgi:hypothetical protein